LAIRLRRIGGGEAARRRALPAAKRAFCHGTVKNQQGLDSEVFQISSGEKSALPNFYHSRENFTSENYQLPNFSQSRDKSSGANFSRAAPGAQAKLANSREAGAAPL
jgi:hypothetical protein